MVNVPYIYRNVRLKPRQWVETYYYALGNVWKGDDPTLFKYQIHGRMVAGIGVWAKGIVAGEVNVRDSYPRAVEWTIKGFYTTSYYRVDPTWAVIYLEMWNLVRIFAGGKAIAEVNVDGGWDYKEFMYILDTPYTTADPRVTIEREVGMVGTGVGAYAGCGTGKNIAGGGNIGVLLIADVTVSEAETANLIVTCVDKYTMRPVGGVEVTVVGLERRSGKTDSSGTVVFENLIAGTYTVTASKLGYYGQTIEAVTVTPPSTSLTISLEPTPGLEYYLKKYWYVPVAAGVGGLVLYKVLKK